ncbi:MAG: hypothetical protein ACRD4S_07750 [Candidatus Acidiferrales bacterium]
MNDSHGTRLQKNERTILARLCGGSLTHQAREAVVRTLAGYAWNIAEHRIVYDAIRRIGGESPERLRERLPAEATRMGFPDVEWDNYFHRDEAETAQTKALAKLADELLSIARGDLRDS